jgi:hypothetical protein
VLKGKESNIKENREKNERSKWLGMKWHKCYCHSKTAPITHVMEWDE